MPERILVIKLASLGDFVQAFGPFAAIRAQHPRARITLLTTPPYRELGERAPWFDAVWTGGRPKWRDLGGLWRLARFLRGGGFSRVYDLQTSSRSSRYRWMLPAGVEWSGIGGGSHPHANPQRDYMHTLERQREQLEMAGLTAFPPPALDWLDADLSGLGLPERFGVVIPGASPTRPGKRWPVAHYAALAAGLDLPVAVVGGPSEAPLAAEILARVPGAVDLTGRTNFAGLGAVARRASFAVGNDTGPTHMMAAAGCPTLALFGDESDPALCAPRGPRAEVLRQAPLAGLAVERVRATLDGLRAGSTR
jgi:ADP-heptose:LPS heptosyltransferase